MQKEYAALQKLDYGYDYWDRLSSGITPKEFKSWATKHSNQIKKIFSTFSNDWKFEKVSKGHFHYSFFAYSENYGWVYVFTSDVRGKLEVIIRTAENNKDYSGGRNNFIDFSSEDRMERSFISFFSQIDKNRAA